MDMWIGISLVICAFALLRWTQGRSRREGLSPGHVEKLEARLSGLEQRLGDVQEVVLAIDEKLEHLQIGAGRG